MKRLTEWINLIAAIVRLADVISRTGWFELLQKAPADPANHGDGLAVADRLVAGAVRAFAGLPR